MKPTALRSEPAERGASLRASLWPVRVARWTTERHGLGVLILTAVLFTLALSAGAIQTVGSMGLGRIDAPVIALGFAAFWSWYLMLRALDDLEDFGPDAIAHPDRMLQRGLVSSRDLWGLILACAVFQGLASAVIDARTETMTVTLTWLSMTAFLGAVATDFGAPTALAARPLLRRTLRLPASVLPLAWAYGMGATDTGVRVEPPFTVAVAALIATGFCTLAVVDIARKFGPAQAGELSWPDRLGELRAFVMLSGLVAGLGAACIALIVTADGRWAGYLAPALCGVTASSAYAVFRQRDAGAALYYALVFLLITITSLIGAAA